MKTLKINLMSYPYVYTLPEGMDGKDWIAFKTDYSYFIEKAIAKALRLNEKSVIIEIDKLPNLSDDFDTLKSYMKAGTIENKNPDVLSWNEQRERAKLFFTYPTICELDASGFIKQCVL